MSSLEVYSSLDTFAFDILRSSPFTESELRFLKYGVGIPLLPEITADRIIAEIAFRSKDSLDHQARINYLTLHFSRLIDRAIKARSEVPAVA